MSSAEEADRRAVQDFQDGISHRLIATAATNDKDTILDALKAALGFATVNLYPVYVRLISHDTREELHQRIINIYYPYADALALAIADVLKDQRVKRALGEELQHQTECCRKGVNGVFEAVIFNATGADAQWLLDIKQLIPFVSEMHTRSIRTVVDLIAPRLHRGEKLDINEVLGNMRSHSVSYFWFVVGAGATQLQAETAWTQFSQEMEEAFRVHVSFYMGHGLTGTIDPSFSWSIPAHFLMRVSFTLKIWARLKLTILAEREKSVKRSFFDLAEVQAILL